MTARWHLLGVSRRTGPVGRVSTSRGFPPVAVVASVPARRASAGRSAPARSALMRSTACGRPRRPRCPGAGARPSPAGPRAPPDPGRRPRHPGQPPPRRHPHRFRPGRAPIRRVRAADCGLNPLPTRLDPPTCPVNGVRNRPCGPLGTAQRLSDAHQQPGDAPIRPDRPPSRPRRRGFASLTSPSPAHHRPGDRQARSTTHQPPSAHHHHHHMSPCPPTTTTPTALLSALPTGPRPAPPAHSPRAGDRQAAGGSPSARATPIRPGTPGPRPPVPPREVKGRRARPR